jgi:hypothetical protein
MDRVIACFVVLLFEEMKYASHAAMQTHAARAGQLHCSTASPQDKVSFSRVLQLQSMQICQATSMVELKYMQL